MTLSEFKAWLDGFADAMGDAPTADQWTKIKAKLAQVREGVTLGGQHAPFTTRTWLTNPAPVFIDDKHGKAGWPLPEPNMCATSLGDAIKAAPNMGEWEAKQ